MIAGATLAAIAWGALAFGAVYPWAYTPLALCCTLVGLAALWHGRHVPLRAIGHAPVLIALAAVAAAVAMQLVPLPDPTREAVSPASTPLLAHVDLQYAASRLAPDAASASRPLSVKPEATLRSLGLLVAFAVLLAGLTSYFSREGIASFAPPLIAFGVVLALAGIVQKALLGDHAWGGMKIYGFWEPQYKLTTPFGPYVNKNHFAGWMVMALPVALGYFLALADRGLRLVHRGWRNRLLWLASAEGGRLQLVGFATILMSVALLLTMSRSGIACFGTAVAVAGIAAFRTGDSRGARIGVVLALAVMLSAPVLWAGVDLRSRFASSADSSLQLRREVWHDTLAIIRDFPLTGTGLNTFGTATLKYQTARSDLHFREAHNDYLQIAAEGGLLIGVPVAVLLLLFASTVGRRVRRDSDDRTTGWVRFGATTGLAAIGLQSLVEFSLQMPGNAVLFVVLCAMALHKAPRRHDRTAGRA